MSVLCDLGYYVAATDDPYHLFIVVDYGYGNVLLEVVSGLFERGIAGEGWYEYPGISGGCVILAQFLRLVYPTESDATATVPRVNKIPDRQYGIFCFAHSREPLKTLPSPTGHQAGRSQDFVRPG